MSEPRQIPRWPGARGWWALSDRANDLIEIDIARPGHTHHVLARCNNARVTFYEAVSPEHSPVCPELWDALRAIEEESQLTCQVCATPGEERPGHYYRTYCLVHRSGEGETNR